MFNDCVNERISGFWWISWAKNTHTLVVWKALNIYMHARILHTNTSTYTSKDTQSMKMKIRREIIENLLKMFLSQRIQRHTNHRKYKLINHLNNILTEVNVTHTNNWVWFTFSCISTFFSFSFWEMNICATRSVSYATPFLKLNNIWSLWSWIACDDTMCLCAFSFSCICICVAVAAHKMLVKWISEKLPVLFDGAIWILFYSNHEWINPFTHPTNQRHM